MYNLQNPILRGAFEAYQKDYSLSSLLETFQIYYKLLPGNAPEHDIPEEINYAPSINIEEKHDDDQGGDNKPQENGKKDEAKDYDKVKEHMHMVLARYAKEGIIDYKEAAQIHDVFLLR